MYVILICGIIIFLIFFSFLDLDAPTVDISTTSPKEGDDVTFTCIAVTTDSITQYTWHHNNIQIIGENSEIFQLSGGNRINSGNYSCKVTTAASLKKISSLKSVTYLCTYKGHQVLFLGCISAVWEYLKNRILLHLIEMIQKHLKEAGVWSHWSDSYRL